MSDITDAGPRLRSMNDALEENDRLQAEIARLRSRPCPYVTGGMTSYCTLTPLTLTDAERGAVEEAIGWYVGVDDDRCQQVAAVLRGLLERLAPIAACDTTPAPPSTPNGCTVPPEWTSRPYWVDPPSGHRYGFPRLYDPAKDGDMTEWLIAQGYPEQLARQGLACTFTACTESSEK